MERAPTPKKSIYDKIDAFVQQWVPTHPLPNRSSHIIADFFQYYGQPVCVDFDELFHALRKYGYIIDEDIGTISKPCEVGNLIETKAAFGRVGGKAPSK